MGEQLHKYRPFKVLIEEKSSGISLLQEIRSIGVYCVEAYKLAPGSDKIMRLGLQTIKFESGRVHLPKRAPWLDDYVRELTGFPGSKFNDQVDSTSQALDVLGRFAIPVVHRPLIWPPFVPETW